MGQNNYQCWIAVLLVGLGFATACAGEKSTPSAAAKQIAQWVEQLDHRSYSVRESASRSLVKAGNTAIEAVAAAADGRSLEMTVRTFQILEEWASSADDATAHSAKEALAALAASDRPATANRARNALRAYQQHIAATLESCGARLEARGNQIVSVNFDAATELGTNLRLLHELPDIEHLSFSTPLMDDRGLAELKGLPRLREINLYRSHVSDAGLKVLTTLPSLRRLPMGETQVTDQGLVHLKELTQLEYLGLRGNQVTDAGLAHLQNLTNLTGLYLGETQVTDAGLAHLRRLTKLSMLRIDHTKIGDAGLVHLKGFADLRDLDLSDTRVTAIGVAVLQKALPMAQIRTKQP